VLVASGRVGYGRGGGLDSGWGSWYFDDRDRFDDLAINAQIFVVVGVESDAEGVFASGERGNVAPRAVNPRDLFAVEIEVGMAFARLTAATDLLGGKRKVCRLDLHVPPLHWVGGDDQLSAGFGLSSGDGDGSMAMTGACTMTGFHGFTHFRHGFRGMSWHFRIMAGHGDGARCGDRHQGDRGSADRCSSYPKAANLIQFHGGKLQAVDQMTEQGGKSGKIASEKQRDCSTVPSAFSEQMSLGRHLAARHYLAQPLSA
jgi:hypothetical protein